MLPRLLVCALALIMIVPAAAAFASPREEVRVAFDAKQAPALVATGALDGAGRFEGAAMFLNASGSRIGPIPTLTIGEGAGEGQLPRVTNVSDATIVIHAGTLTWPLDGAALPVELRAPYAFALAIPESPFSMDGEASPGVILAGPAIHVGASWTQGDATLIPVQAEVSVFGADGKVLDGWDRRRVNENAGADPTQGGEGVVAFVGNGAFDASLQAQGVATGLGSGKQDFRLDVRPASEDKFLEAVRVLAEAASQMGGEGGDAGLGDAQQLEALEAVGSLLNGAVVIVQPPEGEAVAPREARLSEREVELGFITVFRSQDLALSWAEDEMRVQGTSMVAVTADGFNVKEPAAFGPIPVLSAFLWVLAAGAIVYYFVKRPPKGEHNLMFRFAAMGASVLTLVIVFFVWDASFASTFGTSVITMLREQGADVSVTQLMFVFGLEMIPWGLAALLFALPVRIIAGVALRYLGKGKSFKGVANAAGLVSLAIFGPAYALWLVNLIAGYAMDALGGAFG